MNVRVVSSGQQCTTIKFNQGQTLLHLAGMYPTLLDVVLELVQNALDKDVQATRVWISVNRRTGHLAVRDNGAGATVEKFNSALASVAQPGRKGEGSLGQFGIGLISPLGKCERFTFTSCPSPDLSGFQEWTFVTRDIVSAADSPRIPVRKRTDLVFGKEGLTHQGQSRVEWRSEVSLTKFTSDAITSRIPIDALIGGIQERYATTMRRNNTVISVEITDEKGIVERRPNVTAPDFSGEPLEVTTYENVDAGEVRFRLFISSKKDKGPKGKVLMGVTDSDFRFPFHLFARATTGLLHDRVVEALSSGFFEGEIISEKATLHPTRKAFVHDDAFVGLCCAIEE